MTAPDPSPYTPRPIDTSGISVPPELDALVERLAEHTHDVWAQQRMADGWTHGPARDDATRRHPCLVPYADLPESEKTYDREVARGLLAALLALGWSVGRAGST